MLRDGFGVSARCRHAADTTMGDQMVSDCRLRARFLSAFTASTFLDLPRISPMMTCRSADAGRPAESGFLRAISWADYLPMPKRRALYFILTMSPCFSFTSRPAQ